MYPGRFDVYLTLFESLRDRWISAYEWGIQFDQLEVMIMRFRFIARNFWYFDIIFRKWFFVQMM